MLQKSIVFVTRQSKRIEWREDNGNEDGKQSIACNYNIIRIGRHLKTSPYTFQKVGNVLQLRNIILPVPTILNQ